MKVKMLIFGFLAIIVLVFATYAVLRTVPISNCGENGTGLACIKLPPGFSIDYYAENIEGARSMTLSPNGTLFVGSRDAGKVYAVLDRNNDSKADEVFVLAEGLDMPNGVAFRNGSLYVAEVSRFLPL
jgi:glucose/arabinose dehydrogenase